MKLFSFGLFVVLFFSSSISINVEARESKFFSKFTHLTIFKHKKHSHSIEAPAPSSILLLAPEPSSVHIPIAAPEFAPAPSPIEDEPQNGYGLYGEDYKSIEKEGMSDTRLMENDKYYYNPTEYETGKKSYNNGGYYFGSNEKFSDEFNNFTEENYQEEYKP
ncbi:hypothetical protein ACFE04_029323 [Oxalis oulophora]